MAYAGQLLIKSKQFCSVYSAISVVNDYVFYIYPYPR